MHLASDPRYNWSHSILFGHTSSRVNLGPGELASVTDWTIWGSGMDERANHAKELYYGYINKGHFKEGTYPEIDETLKTIGDNAMRAHAFAGANAIGLFINAVGRGNPPHCHG